MSTMTKHEVDATGLVRSYLAKRTPYRTPGRHTSDIIADLIRTVPSLAKLIDADEDTVSAMWLMGLVWEDAAVIASGWGPDSRECEGIICSPDVVNPIARDEEKPWLMGRLEECKCTWKKMREDIRDDWRWMTQVKTYCYAYRVNWVRFNIMYLNGNYAPPSPRVMVYDLEFTTQEIMDNWWMMKQHMAYMDQRDGDAAMVERIGDVPVSLLRLSA